MLEKLAKVTTSGVDIKGDKFWEEYLRREPQEKYPRWQTLEKVSKKTPSQGRIQDKKVLRQTTNGK